ncbi:hypothetical protein CONPUDRAFT_78969 [Coniophora puteana RWD-64-598 SS2]|uniref:Uncharacterized protein n=1 Tax=Coniophora puteana (strain RWD-64-598) TaxID=741705 RepID=A0A5M3N5N7_CONPW|nr:uncharacterized protein CONPUDRAFT_78969 [Coniophora puteana RWD-64-598 SS2]EIW86703.1 hypothetical protein CONPUDRAFT_78969 [Coniophora puteana RWD-64-598 SS2]
MALMQQYYGQAAAHATQYGQLAAQSTSVQPGDQTFQQQASTQLTGFHENLLGLQGLLDQLGADRGLANEDPANDVETLLKNVVNLNKDVLSSTQTLVSNLPILGPILGPIVYDVKCVLEKVLDGVENLSDSVINAIQPLLKGLLDGVLGTSPTCQSGLNLLGLCI